MNEIGFSKGDFVIVVTMYNGKVAEIVYRKVVSASSDRTFTIEEADMLLKNNGSEKNWVRTRSPSENACCWSTNDKQLYAILAFGVRLTITTHELADFQVKKSMEEYEKAKAERQKKLDGL